MDKRDHHDPLKESFKGLQGVYFLLLVQNFRSALFSQQVVVFLESIVFTSFLPVKVCYGIHPFTNNFLPLN